MSYAECIILCGVSAIFAAAGTAYVISQIWYPVSLIEAEEELGHLLSSEEAYAVEAATLRKKLEESQQAEAKLASEVKAYRDAVSSFVSAISE